MFTTLKAFIDIINQNILGNILSTNNITLELSPKLSWWDARAHCKSKYNGDMFIPGHGHSLYDFPKETYFWIGALQTSEWKWTDNSSLFQHIGYKTTSGFQPNNITVLPGNSVAPCYNRCIPKTYFGLSGTKCYCLDESQVHSAVPRWGDEEACPGNVAEKCGDKNGMSIYKTDIEVWNIETGECVKVYRWYSPELKRFQPRLGAASCNVKLQAVCSNRDVQDGYHYTNCDGHNLYYKCYASSCTSCGQSSWSSTSQKCNLVKVTNNNRENIFKILLPNRGYWIGLYKTKRNIWINGKGIISDYSQIGYGKPKCLALQYMDARNWTAFWVACSEDHQALCVGTLLTTVLTSTESSEKKDLGKTRGLYVGTGLAVLLAAVFITSIVIVMKRKRQLGREAIQCPSATENLAYDSMTQARGQAQNASVGNVYLSAYAQADLNQPDNISDLYSKVDKTHLRNASAGDVYLSANAQPDLNLPDNISDLYSKVDKTHLRAVKMPNE